MKFSGRRARILDLDSECRPLSWINADFVSKEITAIACKWINESGPVEVWALGEVSLRKMLSEFRKRYDQADIVTGHWLTGHDLPLLSGAMVEIGLPPLGNILVQDTKSQLAKIAGISKSQESLGGMLGLQAPKVGMDQTKWRAANRLTSEGIAYTKRRVVGDVRQHVELRARMLKLGLLGPPKLWRGGSTVYEP